MIHVPGLDECPTSGSDSARDAPSPSRGRGPPDPPDAVVAGGLEGVGGPDRPAFEDSSLAETDSWCAFDDGS